jgi:hypothetical protein
VNSSDHFRSQRVDFTLPFLGFCFNPAFMQNVLTYLQENERRFVGELCDYLRFPSVSAQSHHRADVEAAARWLVEHCQSIGLQTRLCPTEGNPVVIARTPRGSSTHPRPHFVVYGHYDVQPAEPFALWKSPPFEPRIDVDRFSPVAPATTRASTLPISKPWKPI